MNENEKKTKSEKKINLVRGLKSINLIPPLTEEEAVVEKSKIKLNVGASISLLVLFLVTLSIVGYNIFAKQLLNNRKDVLFALESEVKEKSSILSANDEILRRVSLYQKIQANTYSVKDIVTYIQNLSLGLGNINSIEVVEGKYFEIVGSSSNLTEVSKLWYVLGNDRLIESINLKTVAKDSNSARFTFEGELKLEQFKKEFDNG